LVVNFSLAVYNVHVLTIEQYYGADV